jgi:hypothetical protein
VTSKPVPRPAMISKPTMDAMEDLAVIEVYREVPITRRTVPT